MSAWSTLSRQLVQIEIEIRSAQAPTRHKALDRLKSLMDTRADELAALFEGRHYAPETTWLSLVHSANEACVQQASRLEKAQNGKGLSAAENKTGDHIVVLQKSMELANADRVNVAYGHVLEWVLHCFGDRWMVRYFGTCYLQVVYEHMLQGSNLEEVKLNDWTRLLSGCLHIYDNVHIQRLTLLQCFPPIVEFGCRYTYLSATLVQHLPKIEEIIAGDLGTNAFSELIRTIFLISSSLALDNRLTVCHHLETILGSVIAAFSGRMPAVAKRTLFQLFHLAITVHSPEGNVCAASSSSYTANRAVWHRHLRNMFHLLQNDVKLQHSEILRGDTNPKMCEVFVSLAAALCAVVFWDTAVWTETDGNGEPTAKRHRRPERLEGVMELVKLPKGTFCWRWMSILAELLATNPTSLTADDFMPLLQMLHDFQLQIRYPVEVETLGRLVGRLLNAESALQAAHPFIDATFCDDLWHKIAQTAFRTTSPALLHGNVDLIRRLVVHKRCLPDTFLETVLRTFLSDALRKSNASVRLFIAILRHNNIDAIDQADVKEMRHNTMRWLHRQKISLVSTEGVEPALIAELTVLCLFTKIDPAVVRRLDADAAIDSPSTDFARFLSTLKGDMLLNSMRRLIVAHRQEAAHKLVTTHESLLPPANNLLAVINEQHFDCLFEIINADADSADPLDTPNTFNRTTAKLIMYLQLLNQLIAYGSMDQERLDKTFLAKKCHLKLEELEMCASRFCESSDFGFKESMDVLERLRLIFEAPLHQVLVDLIHSHDLGNMIEMLQKWLGEGELDSRKICLRTFAALNSANQRRYETFTALALLAKGANEERAFGAIHEFGFNLSNNADILIVLRLLRIVLGQKSTAVKASWCFDQVKAFCQMYYQNQQLMVAIIDLIPDLARFINQYDSMTDDLLQLFVSFLTLAKKRKYGPHITEKLIRSLISVASAYPDQLYREDFSSLYLVLSRFITAAQPLHIQFAAVETLSHIFDANWIRSFTTAATISLNTFHRSLYHAMPPDVNDAPSTTEDAIAGIDRSNRWIGVRMQLLSAIIASSPLLCADAWFQLLDFADRFELCADYVSGIVRDLCQFMHIDRDVFVAENMPSVLAQWLRSGHPVEKFPWAIESRATSLKEFCRLHAKSMLQSVLRWRPAALSDFRRMIGAPSVRAVIEPIIAECLAYLLPLLSNCPDMPDKYTECAQTMHAVLQENIVDFSEEIRTKSQQIIECLLCSAWDANKFGKWFQFDLDLELDAHMVNATNFDKCLAYMQTHSKIPGSTLLQGLCNFQPKQMFQLVQHMKVTLQKARQCDQKLVTFYQYATLVQHILEFLHREPLASAHNAQSGSDNAKTFFVRDISNFLCNQLVQLGDTNPQLSLAMLELLHTSCLRLLPKRVNYVRPHFNQIVSTLLGVAASNAEQNDCSASSSGPLSSVIFASALRCLRFLIIDQQQPLSVEIALLDDFPAQLTAFDELRQTHAHIKYRGRQFSLREELECFLKVDHRKTEGLATLREHLAANKTELADIFRQHEQWMCGAGSGSMAENSSLHRLVVSLLGTIKTGVGEEQKRVEAAKCLGELGPSDLGKFMLQPDSRMHTYKFFATFESATKHFCRIVLDALNDLLLHTDVNIVQAACEAIEFLLEHKDAQDAGDNYPHLSLFNSTQARNAPIYATPKTGQPKLELIFAEHTQSHHDVWIKAVVNELLAYFGDHSLKNVAAVHVPFAECALPLLVQMLLACSHSQVIDALRQSVLGFFEVHQTCRATEKECSGELRPLCLNWASIKAMLNVTECIRIYNLFNVNKKINLNYLHVAMAAEYCEAHFTAVLYADLWAMEQPAQQMDATSTDPALQTLMRNAYTSIGEPDAVLAFLDPIANRSAYLQFNKSWSRILLEQDVLSYAEAPHLSATKANLASSGLYGLANSLPANATTYSAHDECLWRLGEWSALDEQHSAAVADVAPEPAFERDHYRALHCLHIKDELGTVSAIARARHSIMTDLRNTSLECTNNVYRHLQRLALVQQIEDFLPVQFAQNQQAESAATAAAGPSMNVIDKWRCQDRIAYSAFACRETLLAQRITLLRSAGVRAKRRLQNTLNCPVDSVQHRMLLDVAREARHHGELNMAVRYLAALRHMPALGSQTQSGLWLEDAQLSWRLGDCVLAKRLYRRAIDNTDIESSLSRACAMRIYGECLADTQATDTRSVIDEYFLGSLKLLATIEQQREVVAARARMTPDAVSARVLRDRRNAYEAIGKYADREYYSVAMHMHSAQFVQKRDSVAQNERLVVELGKQSSSGNTELKRTRIVLQRNTDMDRKEIADTELELQEYLQLAVKYYVRACTLVGASGPADTTGESGSVIFRIVSLWLANQTNERIVKELRASFAAIASWQFMSVLPQVAVRLTNEAGDFGETVMEIMERCAIDHPQQTIYQILALSNAHVDDPSVTNQSVKAPRVLGAAKLVDRLKRNEKTSLVVSQMSEMCQALINYANKVPTDNKRISSKEPIRKLLNLNYVHCPSLTLSISKSALYPSLTTVHKWSEVLTMVGGINAPKKITCLCSDGRSYPQLLKGKDDMRQDAIMQQVFTILNEMLATNRDTHKARLQVKTYRVVPLTQRSGILEWCANTMPLAEYLVGSSHKPGAHVRFHPTDLEPTYCRKVISTYHRDQKTVAEKMNIFKKMCAQLRPALPYFFLEHFTRPGDWFERRLAYTKSVATTSMIGYILGIGDRHVSNILIDERTAELVHIDFGIAFEQSKCLLTPETIPFRLTRDMVAAIGVSGVDGIFRRSCERTMDVLRQNKRTIVTILEVLLYDPLYAWALSAKQAYSRQSLACSGGEDGGTIDSKKKNVMAERALTRLEAKLNGTEEGTASGATTTVEAHVEVLIKQATNPYNLCRLFEGWQAYL